MAANPGWAEDAGARAVQAAAGGLGEAQSAHWRAIHAYGVQYAFAVVLAIGVTSLCCAAPAVYMSSARESTLIFAIAGTVVVALAFAFFAATTPRRRTGVVLFEQGLVYLDEEVVEVWRFEDIAEVRWLAVKYLDMSLQPSKRRRDKHRIFMTAASGRTVTVDDQFGDVAALGQRIAQEITKNKLPGYSDRVGRGETIEFGPIAVSEAGIQDGSESLPWSQVADITVQGGYLTIKKVGKRTSWSTRKAAGVPNVALLLVLSERLRSGFRQGDTAGVE